MGTLNRRSFLEGLAGGTFAAAAALCSPTRVSIMTGKYPVRLGFTHVIQRATGYSPDPFDRWMEPPTAAQLPLEEVTIAEALKTTGYVSACVGKWHLGREAFYPEKQGFDVNVGGGHLTQPVSYF